MDGRCGPNDQIDIIFIDIDIAPGTSSPQRTYTGSAGIVEMTVSFSVQCADGFSGQACEECFALTCNNGQCVSEEDTDSFSCVCNPGYTGVRCENTLEDSGQTSEGGDINIIT